MIRGFMQSLARLIENPPQTSGLLSADAVSGGNILTTGRSKSGARIFQANRRRELKTSARRRQRNLHKQSRRPRR
jgi:hypothetical protein